MTIVALDDNHHTLALVRSVLRSLGIERVRCYLRPESALAAIEGQPPELVVTDWELGPVSGLQFVRALRSSKNPVVTRLPIIMLTAHSDINLVKAARDAGVDSFVVKPFSARTLAERIATVRRRTRGFIHEDGYVGPDRRSGAAEGAGPQRRADDRAAEPAMPSRDELIAAEARIAELRDRFEASLPPFVAQLAAAAEAIGQEADATERCRRLAHDLKGQGTSFGYPLLTEFAGSLSRLLAEGRAQDPLLVQLAGLHVKAIAAVVQGRISGDGGEVGRALRDGFERTITRIGGARAVQ